ncbi:MAG: IS200/IS605 family transposase [Hydrococcus sp. C42_A2020_068]|nr:IS200/IS605 family transposase [Hydrococcus sp. C42_A2020_068]
MKPRKGSHSVFSVRLHFVLVTHYRRKVITAPMSERLREMFWQVCRKMDCELIEFSGESDRVRALVDFHPKNSISAVAGSLKSSSARTMKKDFPEEVSKFYDGVSFWSNSYYVASTGGAPIDKLKEYIKSQEKPVD